MKKTLIALGIVLLLASASSASIIAQAQVNSMGTGVGVGLSLPTIPILMDFGVEANTAVSPWSLQQKGEYTDSDTGAKVKYDGTMSWKGTRYGVFTKLNLIVVSAIIHAGAQQADINLSGDIRIPGQDTTIDENAKMAGSYVSIGIPFYLGPLFIEPSFGTQSIYIPHFANIRSVAEFQISCGLSLL